MTKRGGPVIIDTNVIIEAFKMNVWDALAGAHRLETVEECVNEARTGKTSYDPKSRSRVDVSKVESSLDRIHSVNRRAILDSPHREDLLRLHDGERDLWAFILMSSEDAEIFNEEWKFCGPDEESVKFGMRHGFKDRIVSFEKLLEHAGVSKINLQYNYTEKWMVNQRNKFIMGIL